MSQSKSNFVGVLAIVAILVIFAGVFFWLMLDLASVGEEPLPIPDPQASAKTDEPPVVVLPKYDLPAVDQVATRLNFVDRTKQSQLSFKHQANYTPEKYLPEIMSSGVLVADFNNDGSPDIWCINGGNVNSAAQRPADCHDRLFLNNGAGVFADVTAAWGVDKLAVGYGMGGAIGDYDNDGRCDVFLTSWLGGDRLLRNTGVAFEDVTTSAGLGQTNSWGSSAGFCDYNRDGTLDLYVVRYVDYTLANAFRCYVNNIHVYCAPMYTGVPDNLYRNNGDGTFTDVSDQVFPAETRQMKAADGVEDLNKNKGLAVGIGDVNADGWPDIYVANDISRNMLYINRGDGTFDEVGREIGVAYGEDGNEQSGMGVAFSDSQGTGRIDIVCTNFQKEPTNLYIQSPEFVFADRADQKGIGASSRARLSFGINFFDPDNDGDEDLAVANGHIHDNVAEFSSDVTFAQPNTLYEAIGGGKFKDVTTVAGDAWKDIQVSRGLAIADFNGDGRQDFVVSNNNGTYQIAMNETAAAGNFVAFRLAGNSANRSAIGSKITCRVGDRTLTRELYGATSYLAMNELVVHFGIGSDEKVAEATITWPDGKQQTVTDLAGNHYYTWTQDALPQTYVPGKLKPLSE